MRLGRSIRRLDPCQRPLPMPNLGDVISTTKARTRRWLGLRLWFSRSLSPTGHEATAAGRNVGLAIRFPGDGTRRVEFVSPFRLPPRHLGTLFVSIRQPLSGRVCALPGLVNANPNPFSKLSYCTITVPLRKVDVESSVFAEAPLPEPFIEHETRCLIAELAY